ncbi:MAG: BON domain-containing protein [Acidobacteriota bacterium]|nr:BON domain-containing protein [Acidobacteriota bacterium]
MKQGSVEKLLLGAALSLGVAAGVAAAANTSPSVYTDSEIAQKAAHEIRMYSRYTIWDNVNLRVNNGNVELLGQVSQPFKKSDLQRVMRHVPGVESVTNDLKVLPLSPFDDRLRLQVARALYRDPVLSRYSIQAIPPIHIIVDNGHVTLEGVVNTDMEKEVAGVRANSSGLSFGTVTNNLRVENPSKAQKG